MTTDFDGRIHSSRVAPSVNQTKQKSLRHENSYSAGPFLPCKQEKCSLRGARLLRGTPQAEERWREFQGEEGKITVIRDSPSSRLSVRGRRCPPSISISCFCK